MPDDMEHSEVTEILDKAWGLIFEALELIRYARMLIDNTTEKARWPKIEKAVRELGFATMRLVWWWDMSPTGRHVREEAKEHGANT